MKDAVVKGRVGTNDPLPLGEGSGEGTEPKVEQELSAAICTWPARTFTLTPGPSPFAKGEGKDRESVANVLASSRMRCPGVFQNHEP